MSIYSSRVKYPKTLHLPWSLGLQSDDKLIQDLSILKNSEIAMTEKMDGENTTIYSDNYLHSRSTTYSFHPSRSYVKELTVLLANRFPSNYRICGENLFGKHSIKYYNLESYFLVYSIWKEDECLSWSETLDWCQKLNLTTVPRLYSGQWLGEKFTSIWKEKTKNHESEGYVVRISDSFQKEDFSRSIAKYVRQDHVITSSHWMTEEFAKNSLQK
jgi:hypothetical protein